MSIKQDILKHKQQLSPHFRKAVMDLPDDADLDKPFIKSALVQYGGQHPLNVPGIESISAVSGGGFVTAQNISPNGLKNLLDVPRVSYVDGGGRFAP